MACCACCSRASAQPSAGGAIAYSFNDPRGACPGCGGLGKKVGVVSDDFLDMSKSLNGGAVQVPFFTDWDTQAYTLSGFFDNDKKLSKFTKAEMELLLHGKDKKFKAAFGGKTINLTYAGIIAKIERSYVQRDIKTLSERTQKAVMPYLKPRECPSCKGARLNAAALASRIGGHNIADLSSLEVGELVKVVRAIKEPRAAPIAHALVERLQAVVDIGLEYLSLNRETDTLSGGESQRVKMVKHLGSSLVDVMYIFDEPSVGLHPRDVHRLNELLQQAARQRQHRHRRRTRSRRDQGRGSRRRRRPARRDGRRAHRVRRQLRRPRPGRHADGPAPAAGAADQARRAAAGRDGCGSRTRATTTCRTSASTFPPVCLTLITGVAGSGKSSLINEAFLRQHPGAVVIDQSAVGTSTRSNPATYTGVMDDVRKVFAAANKVDAVAVQLQLEGRVRELQRLRRDLHGPVVPGRGASSPCEICQGRRFKEDVLAYTLNGKSISDALALTVADALAFFTQPPILRKLEAMRDVGLHYLTLGQPLSTLSGGECQRLKLASELHKAGSVYVLDEPTTGLHMSDVANLLAILDRLVDGGNSVIVIEHNMDVVRRADWIIDLGPEGGSKGGRVVFEGTPAALLGATGSLTSRYLEPRAPAGPVLSERSTSRESKGAVSSTRKAARP